MTTEEDAAGKVKAITPDECSYQAVPDGPLCRKPARYQVHASLGSPFDGCLDAGIVLGLCEEHAALMTTPVGYSMSGDVAKGKDRSLNDTADETERTPSRPAAHIHRWGDPVLDTRYPDHPGGEVRHYYHACLDCGGRELRIAQMDGEREVILHDWFTNT
jgi:hypothetical protein